MPATVRLALTGAIGAALCFGLGAWWKGREVGLIFVSGFALYFVAIEVAMPWWYARAFRRALSSGARAPSPESRYRVDVGAVDIALVHPDGRTERIAIADLAEIRILTNDTGPWATDVWWALTGASAGSGFAVPGGATGEDALLAFAQTLPGFDNDRVVAAMGSTANAEFVCWRRAGVPP